MQCNLTFTGTSIRIIISIMIINDDLTVYTTKARSVKVHYYV